MQTVENIVLSVRLQTFAREVLGFNSGGILGIFRLRLSQSVFAVTDTEASSNPLLSPPKSLSV
jgi:hypothetical protein